MKQIPFQGFEPRYLTRCPGANAKAVMAGSFQQTLSLSNNLKGRSRTPPLYHHW
jgi:hypothetical protein